MEQFIENKCEVNHNLFYVTKTFSFETMYK